MRENPKVWISPPSSTPSEIFVNKFMFITNAVMEPINELESAAAVKLVSTQRKGLHMLCAYKYPPLYILCFYICFSFELPCKKTATWQ